MRISLTTTPNSEPVPFEYQQKLVGVIHRWIGKNNIHDRISLYSFSWLHGGVMNGHALSFPHGASMFISFYDDSVIRRIVDSILSNPMMFCGIEVTDVMFVDEPDFSNKELFLCASPIFVKRRQQNGEVKQLNYDDEQTKDCLKETLLSKMKEVGLEDESLDIGFDLSYKGKKTKLVRYHGIGNKANFCPVIIKAKPETKLFAWHVGIGNCTGIGFGAIY